MKEKLQNEEERIQRVKMSSNVNIPKHMKFILGGSSGTDRPLPYLGKMALGMSAGACGALVGNPLEVVLIRMCGRLQAMTTIDNIPEYRGLTDVFLKVLRKEGVFAFWKGFTPYFLRMGPYTVLSFMFLEQLNAAYLRRFGPRERD
ncbi:hypothetical protein ANCCEY_14492 [Ancylostoma ceylanicum]|uniref:Uncharacterized protein n=1 Tax=Ancylostoma ceylanicum TaxID=53326 RepID=A0A0D6L5G5_9BILA|nr:hypothetical protein ANCCEY_14492 [Ancylostoma ceylanicum]